MTVNKLVMSCHSVSKVGYWKTCYNIYPWAHKGAHQVVLIKQDITDMGPYRSSPC